MTRDVVLFFCLTLAFWATVTEQADAGNEAIISNMTRIFEKLDLIGGKLDEMGEQYAVVQNQVQANANEIQKTEKCRKLWLWSDVVLTKFFRMSSGRTFQLHDDQRLDWYDARDWCRMRGMDLPTMKTVAELEDMSKALKAKEFENYSFWLSANGNSLTFFYWSDGSEVTKDLWAAGSPNSHPYDSGSVVLDTSDRRLHDYQYRKFAKYFSACEVPQELAHWL